MQYVLTEEEYIELVSSRNKRTLKQRQSIQKLCTLAAIHVPVPASWISKDMIQPWGCILDEETNPEYCDDCPVQDECPHGYKRYSK